jgi:hypothetical protein
MRRPDAASLSFSVVNAVGSGLLAYVAVAEDQVGFFILEGVWFLVSLAGIARAIRAAPSS